MKKILAKIAGIITIFAMTFSPVLATPPTNDNVPICHAMPSENNPYNVINVDPNGYNGHGDHEGDIIPITDLNGDQVINDADCELADDEEEEEACEEVSTIEYKSGTDTQVDGNDAVLVTQPVNAGWTASISGADWIWSEAAVLDATVDTTRVFTHTFDISGEPNDIEIDVAADNSYKMSVNGTELEADATEFNYTAEGQDNYTIPASELNEGENTISFEVKNWGLAESTPESNPAGLMYKFTVNDCAEDDEEDECDEESYDNEDCDEEENDNPGACDEVWARINITTATNLGDGDMTNNSYVGSNANQIANNTWFMLHNGTNYIVDPVIDSYEDVPGLAVQRMNGQVRVLIHGSDEPAPTYLETVVGHIEFWNANITGQSPDNSGNNKLEDGTGGSHDDEYSVVDGMSHFDFRVDEADDAFYTSYNLDTDCGEPEVCASNANLIVNGGFEAPVSPAGGWDEYDSGTPGLGWNVAWNGAFVGAPATAKLELHRGVNGWVSDEGSQHAELDADWGYNNNEQASVKISQTVVTEDGADYALSYAFSPRPGTGAGENVLQVYVNGILKATHGPVAGVANTFWTTYTVNFEGTGSDIIEFRDAGTPNTLGTLLDDVKVNCVNGNNEPEVCTQGAPLYARVKIDTSDVTKWRNWTGGNLAEATPFFVGGSNPLTNELSGNVYDANEWFPLTNPDGSFIDDADIAGYSNVPGVAIERQYGAIRVVVYGNHTGAGKELVAGSIELSTNASARLLGAWDKPNGFVDPVDTYTRLHNVTVNDALNPMDSRGTFNGYIHQYDPRFDNVRVNSDLFQFHLVVTSATDGFYARYNFDDMIEVPCGEVNPQ